MYTYIYIYIFSADIKGVCEQRVDGVERVAPHLSLPAHDRHLQFRVGKSGTQQYQQTS
jgi:hypothetical protein